MTAWKLYDWPFFDKNHQRLGEQLIEWTPTLHSGHGLTTLEQEARFLAREFGKAGLLDYVVLPEGGKFDVRALCIVREFLGFEHIPADSVYAMQGLGTAALQFHGSEELKAKYLPKCRSGESIAALAISEPQCGSDVANIACAAVKDGNEYVINGQKTWITNAPFADHYLLLARTGEAPGARGLSLFMVDAGTKGLECGPPIDLIAPHPVAALNFTDCRIPASNLIGQAGQGFKLAMGVFDYFRTSVGAAGVGIGRRCIQEALGRVTTRPLFGKMMADIEGVQMKIADMVTEVEVAALAVYRAAWSKDVHGGRGSKEASIAKLLGSEAAGHAADTAIQLFGGLGVMKGTLVEQLYREARPMRIYEGASEVQKLVISRAALAEFSGKA